MLTEPRIGEGASLLSPRGDLEPRLRATLDVRVIGGGTLTVIPVRLSRLLDINRWRLNDDRWRRVVVGGRVIPPVGVRRAPPESRPNAHAHEHAGSGAVVPGVAWGGCHE